MYTKVYIFIHVCGSIEGRKGECLDPRPLKIQKIRIYVVKFWKICLGLPQTNWNTSRPPHPSPGKKLWIRECTLFISICSNVSITEPVDLHTGYLLFLQWRHLHIPNESQKMHFIVNDILGQCAVSIKKHDRKPIQSKIDFFFGK